MDSTVKKVIAVAAVAFIAAIWVYGSYLPVRKAQIFISTLQELQTKPVTSLDELKSRLSAPLDYPSPIGQEELVRNMANSVLAFVQRGADPTSTSELIGFLDSYYDPIISRGKGMSFGQDVYLLGMINELAFAHTGDGKYMDAAKKYYVEANQLGPDRPQPLYGLFDVYRTMGDVPDTQMVVDKILANWPDDQGVRAALAQFLNTVKPITAPVKPAATPKKPVK